MNVYHKRLGVFRIAVGPVPNGTPAGFAIERGVDSVRLTGLTNAADLATGQGIN